MLIHWCFTGYDEEHLWLWR